MSESGSEQWIDIEFISLIYATLCKMHINNIYIYLRKYNQVFLILILCISVKVTWLLNRFKIGQYFITCYSTQSEEYEIIENWAIFVHVAVYIEWVDLYVIMWSHTPQTTFTCYPTKSQKQWDWMTPVQFTCKWW